jgi:putative DNA primase/helicase
MVTAHETDEAAELREGFVKQATGGDALKGRWMRGDFFEFKPTHKIQLLTNHKPAIRGQDFGIWRRILLLYYPKRFGDATEVAAGRADIPADKGLPEALRQERAGIFAWVVRGATEWYRDGLNPPDSVIADGRDYQHEQDRVEQFVTECCTCDPDEWTPFSGAFGLYPSYSNWCDQNGYNALGKVKFVQELERITPNFRREERTERIGNTRRTVRGAFGLRLIDNDTGTGNGLSADTVRPTVALVDKLLQ